MIAPWPSGPTMSGLAAGAAGRGIASAARSGAALVGRSGAPSGPDSAGGPGTNGSVQAARTGPPAWAGRMTRAASLRHGATAAAHAVRSGDSSGSGTTISLSEKDS
jgi:type IV secretion system protein TrbL